MMTWCIGVMGLLEFSLMLGCGCGAFGVMVVVVAASMVGFPLQCLEDGVGSASLSGVQKWCCFWSWFLEGRVVYSCLLVGFTLFRMG